MDRTNSNHSLNSTTLQPYVLHSAEQKPTGKVSKDGTKYEDLTNSDKMESTSKVATTQLKGLSIFKRILDGVRLPLGKLAMAMHTYDAHNLTKTEIKEARADFENHAAKIGVKHENIKITNNSGNKLDGEVFLGEGVKSFEDLKDHDVIIYSNGNGMSYEDNGMTQAALAKNTGATVIGYNPRGVGNSEGDLSSIEDLKQDLQSIVQELIKKGVPPERIIIHGHSMSGGVTSSVAKRLKKQGVNLKAVTIHNSYSSMGAAATHLTKNMLPEKVMNFVLKLANWSTNSLKNLEEISDENGPKIIILIAQIDKVIPGSGGGPGLLAGITKKETAGESTVTGYSYIEMKHDHEKDFDQSNGHSQDLQGDPAGYLQYVNLLRGNFNKKAIDLGSISEAPPKTTKQENFEKAKAEADKAEKEAEAAKAKEKLGSFGTIAHPSIISFFSIDKEMETSDEPEIINLAKTLSAADIKLYLASNFEHKINLLIDNLSDKSKFANNNNNMLAQHISQNYNYDGTPKENVASAATESSAPAQASQPAQKFTSVDQIAEELGINIGSSQDDVIKYFSAVVNLANEQGKPPTSLLNQVILPFQDDYLKFARQAGNAPIQQTSPQAPPQPAVQGAAPSTVNGKDSSTKSVAQQLRDALEEKGREFKLGHPEFFRQADNFVKDLNDEQRQILKNMSKDNTTPFTRVVISKFASSQEASNETAKELAEKAGNAVFMNPKKFLEEKILRGGGIHP